MIKREYKHNNIERNYAYTLAEMLIVLVIISVVMLSLPKVTKKVFRVETIRAPHGRFECFWKSFADGHKELWQYYAAETVEGRIVPELAADRYKKVGTLAAGATNYPARACEFTPPDTYTYIIMHAVGGGGSGVNVQAYNASSAAIPTIYQGKSGSTVLKSISNTDYHTALSQLYKSSPDLWPDWFKESNMKNHAVLASKDYWEANSIYKRRIVKYGPSGNPGRSKSLFVPKLPQIQSLLLMPGIGGSITAAVDVDGNDGTASQVSILKDVSNKASCLSGSFAPTCNAAGVCTYTDCAPMIVANGGTGGKVSYKVGSVWQRKIPTVSVMLTGGYPSDYGISEYSAVKEKSSGFFNALTEDSNRAELRSKIRTDAPMIGNGGNGSNQFVNNTDGLIFYELNNYADKLGPARVTKSNWVNVTSNVSTNIYPAGSNCSRVSMPAGTKAGRTGYCVKYDSSTNCWIGSLVWNYYVMPAKWDYSGSGNYAQYKVVGNTVYPVSGNTNKYTNCTYKYQDTGGELICDEIMTAGSGYVHNCPKVNKSSVKCTNGNTPNGNYICPAAAGGDGAIVILW